MDSEHQASLQGIRLYVDCSLQAARQACLAIKEHLENCGLGKRQISDWELILAEGINNAVEYAKEERKETPIEVEVTVAAKDVTVRINDHTEGTEWPEEAELPDPISEGGRGIYLIQTLTDHSAYLVGQAGNLLIMRKDREDGEGEAPEESSEAATAKVSELEATVASLEATLDAMTEELSSCYESLSAIFDFSSLLGQSQDTESFSRRLLDHVLLIAEADWFVFRQYFSEEKHLRLLSASDLELQLADLPVDPDADPVGIELAAVRSRQDEWLAATDLVSSDEPLRDVVAGCHTIVHPIFLNEELLGVLTVGRGKPKEAFKAAQISFISTFAEFLAIQIVNVGYEQERISKGIVTRELEIAKNIQRSLLPNELPAFYGYQLAGSCDSAREVGGDFYDVIFLKDDCVVIVIADVMGKGVPAALFAAILHSLVRAMPEQAREPAKLMTAVNRIMYGDLSGVDMFITAQLVFLDPRKGVAKVANAGHCPALISASDRSELDVVCPEGMPLGILEDTEFRESVVELGENPVIMVYTDGITEAADESGEQFGDERLHEWMQRHASAQLSAESRQFDLLETLRNHLGTAAPRDDQTFIIAAKQGS